MSIDTTNQEATTALAEALISKLIVNVLTQMNMDTEDSPETETRKIDLLNTLSRDALIAQEQGEVDALLTDSIGHL